ncbi:pyridoxal-dependent decarboxylase [Synechococcus sp. RedBA-s]|uniref:pyridoxal-dependent decarboxylase n=1 Tax=Synechococcus sp. RedBA-s TaxID=2823741 RepID=UPI0020CB90C5|nr:pyridoxal-dependent decarboxylase [Synechococcus sp. RedBA-s]
MVFWVNDLGGNTRDITLNFSKPGGQMICQYYNFIRLGHEGYRKMHNPCYSNAQHLAAKIEALGPFEMIYGGDAKSGIPSVCWGIKDGEDPGFNLFELADRLRRSGGTAHLGAPWHQP